jgi:hypothetical protein
VRESFSSSTRGRGSSGSAPSSTATAPCTFCSRTSTSTTSRACASSRPSGARAPSCTSGAALAAPHPRGADRARVLAAALPARARRHGGERHVPRRAARDLGDRRRAHRRAVRVASRADPRLPPRPERQLARVHPGPRARPRGGDGGPRAGVDLRARARRARRRPLPRLPVQRGRVRIPGRVGHSSVAHAVQFASAEVGGSCSSTTTRTAPTTESTACRARAGAVGRCVAGAARRGLRGHDLDLRRTAVATEADADAQRSLEVWHLVGPR